jgi:3-oxoacyl-[acyl-carrier protein] reductase
VPVHVDTTDEAACDIMVSRCVEGLGAVDVLVAAAGVGAARVPGAASYQPYAVLDIPIEQFRRVIDVNLYGVLFSNRAVARWMTENRRGGSIINLASIMSKMPSTSAPYSVSKAGVWMLTKCLAQELAGHGIRVNAIGPGFIATPLNANARATNPELVKTFLDHTPLGRAGTAEDIVGPAIFLASDLSAYVSGEIVMVDGGYRAV